jgi:outer membrane protein TolC
VTGWLVCLRAHAFIEASESGQAKRETGPPCAGSRRQPHQFTPFLLALDVPYWKLMNLARLSPSARAALCAGCLLAAAAAQRTTPPAPAAAPQTPLHVTNTAVPQQLTFVNRGSWYSFWQRYQPADIGRPNLQNSALLQRATAKGTLYLSLYQVLRLALTSDLDIANAAYNQLLAKPDYYRTLAGGTARGVAGETISSALFSGAIGASGGGGNSSGGTSAGSVTGGGSGVHGGNGGYDPSLNFVFTDEHSRTPLNNPILFGNAEQLLNQAFGQVSFGQGFTTGTGYSISASSFRQYQNSNQLFLNPEVTSDVSIGVQQLLLNGGSRSVNRASMVMGANSLAYADAAYKLQVTNVVAQAATQYWTLAAANSQLRIARVALERAQQTLDDTRILVRQGKDPAANLVTAESGVSAADQALIQARTDFAIAGSKLKLFLAKQWSPNVIQARVVNADQLPAPVAANLPAVGRLVNRAEAFSPQLAEDRINVTNNDLTVKIKKNQLLPTLAVFASYTSSGVSGLGVNCAVAAFPCPPADTLAPLPGGFATSLGKIFSYQAPDYGFGFQLNVPVWNRLNRSDEASAELQDAQSRVTLQKDRNTVSEQVNEDRLNLEGDVAQLQAAQTSARQFEQAERNAQDLYRMGKDTINDVVVAEIAVITAEKAVVTAQENFANAQVALEKDSGTLLHDYHIILAAPMTPRTVGSLP